MAIALPNCEKIKDKYNNLIMKTYTPKPLDLSDVKLEDDLNELLEAIAENGHDVWAQNRIAEGWSYGPKRDENKKENPDLVPYDKLSESEKRYDREMARQTIGLVKKLGYDIVKREETELYRILMSRIHHSKQEFLCRRCNNVIYRYQVFCDKCGLELDIDWNSLK